MFPAKTCYSFWNVAGYDDDSNISLWKQVWQIATRSVSLPALCRPASVLLHAILEAGVLPYHAISDDVNNIVMTADVNGPGVLVDSSMILMLHLLHLRNAKLPNASQTTCHHIIRWVFMKWNPGKSLTLLVIGVATDI